MAWNELKDNFYVRAMEDSLKMIDKNLDTFVDRYPHVSQKNHYQGEKNDLWTASFFPGMCYLAYDITKDATYLKHSEDYLDSFLNRIDRKIGISHDLGFLYTLSCVADYKLTKNEKANQIARKAASELVKRYNEKGKYIQAWGDMGIGYPDVKIIIDTMLNLPLLYWMDEEPYVTIAKNHAKTAAKYLIRDDYTSFHTYLMNPETGEGVIGKTHQGYQDDSTWARGQAWAVYGFGLSYRYTKDSEFLEVAKKTAEVFISNLPNDFVPYWDFTFNDENPDVRDTSAAAIFCCGLLELQNYVEKEEAKRYQTIVDQIMNSLYENYRVTQKPEANGILGEGMYHRHDGVNECVIWGDYFYVEAIVRNLKKWEPYW